MEAKPQIIVPDSKGWHNKRPADEKTTKGAWKDRSTILIIPCYSKGVHPMVVQNWMSIMAPMNGKFIRMFVTDMEVGHAYSSTIEMILAHPELSTWKYIFTLEHDNLVDPDVLLKIYPDMEGPNGFDSIGSVYYCKGEGGAPMCYGSKHAPLNFIPFEPAPDTVTPCYGLGMGATMFKLDMFKNPQLSKPFFETKQEYNFGVGASGYTQDLAFFEKAGKLGYKFGCTTKTKTGHMDLESGFVW